jgi:hypothetical protein
LAEKNIENNKIVFNLKLLFLAIYCGHQENKILFLMTFLLPKLRIFIFSGKKLPKIKIIFNAYFLAAKTVKNK